MKIGYARVSTQDQKLELQIDALQQDGCERIYQEKKSGKNKERPELEQMLAQLRPGDIVVVWKLDRLGRSLKDLVSLMDEFRSKGIEFVSLKDGINTTTITGRFTFNIFASLSEFIRELIVENTMAGITAARARGRKGGRPAGLSPAAVEKAKKAARLHGAGLSASEIMNSLNIKSSATLYKYLKYAGANVAGWQQTATTK
jgi:DNA invertase Pin-like site-specific DNA recombinase